MKTKGRFIGILAILSLLIAMLPIGPVGAAVAGTAALTGGVVVGVAPNSTTYYSDKTGFNIVTATVTDADLSAARVGTARYIIGSGSTPDGSTVPFTLKASGGNSFGVPVLAGEKIKIDKFSGAVLATGTHEGGGSTTVLTDSGGNFVTAGVAIGDIVTNTTDSSSCTINATPTNTTITCLGLSGGASWDAAEGYSIADATFTLTETARDATDEGVLAIDDIASVVVGGAIKTPTTDYLINTTMTVITFGVAPPAGTDNVVVTYEYSEYDQTTPANTTVRAFGTSVKFGATLATATNSKTIDTIDATAGTIGTTSNVTADVIVVITFVYDVGDVVKTLFTISTPTSTSLGKSRILTGTETATTTEPAVSSNAFSNSVALFSTADLGKIETQAGELDNDERPCGDANGEVRVDELNCTLGLGTALKDRVETASATGLGLPIATTLASDLILQLLPVTNGETLTVTYVDSSPAATITNTVPAAIDLAAPTVTLIQPSQKLYTSITTQQMLARIADTGSGLTQTDISLVQPAGALGTPVISLNTSGGYDASFSPTAALAEGLKTWYIALKDKVGNEPFNVDKGTLGAAPVAAVSVNPFKFTVDTNGPEILSAATGFYLKNPGVTSGTSAEDQKGDKRTYVRAVFNLGTGGAPIDPASVVANDFTVAGVAPLSVLVNSVAHESGTILVGSTVYLEVVEQGTNARPEVKLVGEIKDKAGNARTAGTKTALDRLSPILTVTPSLTYAEKTVAVTVTSSETLGIPPSLLTRITAPTCEDAVGITQTVLSTTLTSWTSTFTNTTGAASKQWVVVTGTDAGGNASIFGDACVAGVGVDGVASTTDVVTFEVDDAAPVVKFPAATGTATEGAVWIVVRYDEFEHTGDTHKTVAVVSATLNGDDVASEVFIGSATTDEAGTALAADDATHATATLARDLAVGTHTFVIVVQDEATNASTSFTHTLKVTAKPLTSIILNPGVNLVSIPGTPVGDGGNLNILLAGLPVTAVTTYDRSLDVAGENPWLTSTYDAEAAVFTGDIAVLEPGKAYFITATARTTAKVLILEPSGALPPTIQVKQGFNAIGFWSISGATSADIDDYLNSIKWTVAYTFDPTPGVGWTVIRPDNPPVTGDGQAVAGMGYLVFVIEDGTLTP